MVGVAKTKEKIDINYTPSNNSRVYINQLADARYTYNNWKNKTEIFWSKYQIKETDMRVKTATFTSNTYLDLTTGLYCVLITSPFHEDFGGVILSVEKDTSTGLYNYQCQDFTRQFMDKVDIIINNVSLHRLIKVMLTGGALPFKGDITKKQKEWKNELSGLRPAYQYEQQYWGVSKENNFNPMTKTFKSIIKGKTTIEVIRDFVLGSGGYIDVYPNKYGALQIEPYHKTDWLKSCVEIPFQDIQDMKVNFNTTNIVTGVEVQSTEQLAVGKQYTSKSVTGLDLEVIFGKKGETISNPNQSTTKNSTKKSNSTVTAKKTNGNPYGTKKKVVWLNSDNIRGKSTDKKFLNDIAKLLKKQGWTTKVVGVGPNFHTEKYMGPKNGVWFCIYGGADAAVFKETVGKNSYTNKLKKLGSRTVIGMRQGCDIRKGGKCYKYLKRAHDDNYSPSSFKGISYPLDTLTKGKVPIMYAGTADKMVAKFLAGGDNPKAC